MLNNFNTINAFQNLEAILEQYGDELLEPQTEWLKITIDFLRELSGYDKIWENLIYPSVAFNQAKSNVLYRLERECYSEDFDMLIEDFEDTKINFYTKDMIDKMKQHKEEILDSYESKIYETLKHELEEQMLIHLMSKCPY